MKLTKLKPNKIKPRVINTFDYETDYTMVEEKLVCLGRYNPISDKYFTKTFYNTEDFINYLFDNKITEVYGYNLKFDSRFFLNFLIKHPNCSISTIRGGSTILSLYMNYNQKEIRFRDFYPFCLTSLDNISENFDLKNKKYPNFDVKDKENWDNFFRYCKIEELEKHCKLDVMILAELINKYRLKFYNEYKLDVIGKNIFSLAGLSMKVYRTHFLEKPINNPFVFRKNREYMIDKTQYNYVRNTYHGGYTGNTDTDLHYNIVSYDINSSYPFQSTIIKFPTGQAFFTDNEEIFIDKISEIDGFCNLTIDFTNTNLKFPVYDETIEEFKSVNGIWNGNLTSIEYNYLKEKNIKMKFNTGLYYSDYDRTYSLKKYMLSMYEKKKNAISEDLRLINKRLLNSLTGKFGQRINIENRINERIISKNYEDIFDTEATIYTVFLNQFSKYCYEKENSESIKSYTLPSWISLICASGRIQLIRMIELTKANYWDTDSVYFDNKYEDILESSNKLGGWKKEHEFEYLRAIAPKLYAGLLIKDKKHNTFNERMFVRSKGINLNNDIKLKKKLFTQILNCRNRIEIKQLRPLSLRQTLRSKNPTYVSENGMIKTNEYISINNMKIKN